MPLLTVNDPTIVGSYGTIFYGDKEGQTGTKGLNKNINKLANELHVKSVSDAIQPPLPQRFHDYARQTARIYGTGTDNPVVAHAVLAEEYSEKHIADEGYIGVRRSALQMALAGQSPTRQGRKQAQSTEYIEGIDERNKKITADLQSDLTRFGDVSPVSHSKPYLKDKQREANWDSRGKHPLPITRSIQEAERLPGGKYYIPLKRKKNDYETPITGAPLGEIGYTLETAPRAWPDHIGYTKSPSRPHKEPDPRLVRGIVEKACSKSAYGKSRTATLTSNLKARSKRGSKSIGGYTDNTVESMYATTTTKRAMKKGSTTKTPNNNNHNNKSNRKSLSAPDAASVVTMPSMLEGYEGNDDDDDSLESMLNDDDFRFTGKRKGATGLGADTAATNISFDNSLYNSNKRDSLLIQEQKKAHPGVATLSPTTNSKVSPQTDKESMESDYRGPSQQPKVNTVSMHEIDDQSVLTGNDTMEYIEDLLDTGLASATIQTSASYRKHLQSVLTEHDDDDNSSSPISYTAHSHTGHPHHHSSHSSKVNENALSCGKLILAEQNSAIKLEREKATKKGLEVAKRQLGAHAKFLKKNSKKGDTSYFESTGHGHGPMTLGGTNEGDDGTLATDTLFLSTHENMIMNMNKLPGSGNDDVSTIGAYSAAHVAYNVHEHNPARNPHQRGTDKKDRKRAKPPKVQWSTLAGKGSEFHDPASPIRHLPKRVTAADLGDDSEGAENKVVQKGWDDYTESEKQAWKDQEILKRLPHDSKHYDKNGELKLVNRMNVQSLIGGYEHVTSLPGSKKKGPGVNDSNATIYNPENNKMYHDQMSEFLSVPTEKSSGNPFRMPQKLVMKTAINKLKPLNVRDPLDYKEARQYTSAGNWNIVKKATKTTKKGIPSREEIHTAVTLASRKALLGYDTRIIETGTLLAACTSHKHSQPGIPAIIDLHKHFIIAAAMNPNPWLLRRDQVASVIFEHLPWCDKQSVRRLCTAYDAQNSGLIRYVRISVSLICCVKPNLPNLVCLLARIEEDRQEKKRIQEEREKAWDAMQIAEQQAALNRKTGYKHFSTDSHSHVHDPVGTNKHALRGLLGDDASNLDDRTEASVMSYTKDNAPEIYLLKLIHGLYEDCEGTTTGQKLSNADEVGASRNLTVPGCGMRLEDIIEALCCMACSVEDELRMTQCIQDVVQYIYEEHRQLDNVLNDDVLEQEKRESELRRNGDNDLSTTYGGGSVNPGSVDMSSQFTARSGFTPTDSTVQFNKAANGHFQNRWEDNLPVDHQRGKIHSYDAYGGGSAHQGGATNMYDKYKKDLDTSKANKNTYQRRWSEYTTAGGTSLLRDPDNKSIDRLSSQSITGSGLDSVSSTKKGKSGSDKQGRFGSTREVNKTYNNHDGDKMKATTMINRHGPVSKQLHHGQQVVRGGDSVAWDDGSTLASSMAGGRTRVSKAHRTGLAAPPPPPGGATVDPGHRPSQKVLIREQHKRDRELQEQEAFEQGSVSVLDMGGAGGSVHGGSVGSYNTGSNTSSMGVSKTLSNGRLHASSLLSHQNLKNVIYNPRVTQERFIKAMLFNSYAMDEFLAQLSKWRGSLQPYYVGGSITYEQSKMENSSYGTKFLSK